MPFHLLAFSESFDSATLQSTTPVPDDIIFVTGNLATVPADLNFVTGLFGLGASATRAQIVAPSLRDFGPVEILPLDVNTLPTAPSRFIDYRFTPVQLVPNEQLQADTAEGGATTRVTVGVWLADGPVVPYQGDIRTVRATATTTLVANAWTTCPITLDTALPAGTYALVGARANSTGAQLFRIAFVGGGYRPGGIGVADLTIKEPDAQRNGGLGVWGTFEHNTIPSIQVLSNSADTAETFALDIAKIA